MQPDQLPFYLAEAIVLFLGIGLHEYAHCKFADLAGDPTPRYYGRVTLNLTKHFEISGVIMMILSTLTGFGIGWGKAAPADPRKMHNPRWDFFISVIAGPISNFLQALIYASILRLAGGFGLIANAENDPLQHFFLLLLKFGVLTNLGLAIFNLIPFGPLDGHWLVGLLLPERERLYWFRFNRQIGFVGLFIVVLLLQTRGISLIQGPVTTLFHLLTGQFPNYYPG